jgi:hypothetical protein
VSAPFQVAACKGSHTVFLWLTTITSPSTLRSPAGSDETEPIWRGGAARQIPSIIPAGPGASQGQRSVWPGRTDCAAMRS